MNWDAIGAVGQMLGSIAVFITLGYLATQIRQVRSQMARDLSHARWQSLSDRLLAMVANSEFSRLSAKIEDFFAETNGGTPHRAWGRMLIDEIGCTSAEVDQFNAMMWLRWFNREQTIVFISDLTAGQRTQFDRSLRQTYQASTPEGRWYDENKADLNPDAVRYIDELVSRPA